LLPRFCGLANFSGLHITILVNWTVYIIRCNDDSLYTGVTTDLARRFKEHFGHRRGAKFFNGRSPREVVYVETGHTRSSACRRESAIKKLTREGKLRLIAKAG
jgi:putative endonuclease